jgi:hypothetical protein
MTIVLKRASPDCHSIIREDDMMNYNIRIIDSSSINSQNNTGGGVQ